MSLKVVKFDTKMYLNFANFREQTSAGGASLGPKTGTSVGWGGLTTFLPDGGTPSSPPGKKTLGAENWLGRRDETVKTRLLSDRESCDKLHFDFSYLFIHVFEEKK